MKFLKWLGFDPEKHSLRTEILAGLLLSSSVRHICHPTDSSLVSMR